MLREVEILKINIGMTQNRIVSAIVIVKVIGSYIQQENTTAPQLRKLSVKQGRHIALVRCVIQSLSANVKN